MARKHRFEPEPLEEPGLDISSLIDVSFLMLIYFIVTSAMTPREGDLSMELPTDSGKVSAIQIDPLKIQLAKDGSIRVGDQLMPDDRTLAIELDRYKQLTDATNKPPMVIVAADDEAKQQRFVDLMNGLSRVGITTITLSGF
jgi:biopolymer transport protein ExbD